MADVRERSNIISNGFCPFEASFITLNNCLVYKFAEVMNPIFFIDLAKKLGAVGYKNVYYISFLYSYKCCLIVNFHLKNNFICVFYHINFFMNFKKSRTRKRRQIFIYIILHGRPTLPQLMKT